MQKKDFKYPSQTGAYAVRVKSGDDWKTHDTCRLHISVGQPYHEGDKMAATIDWAKGRFDNVIVCVNDTLQHTNLMFELGLSREAALDAAWELGQNWIKRNHRAIADCKIVHWGEWQASQDYPEMMDAVAELVKTDTAVRQSLEDTATNIWDRRCGQHPAYLPERKTEFLALAHEYLTTEMAVIGVMIGMGRAIDVYPGTMLPAFDLLKGKALNGVAANLTRRDFARIDFLRNSQKVNGHSQAA